MTKKDLSYKQDKDWIYNFRIRPLLSIINKKAYETWIWWKYLQYFRNVDDECIWFKYNNYWVRSFAISITPPYYNVKQFWYTELVQMAMWSNWEQTRYIIES